MLSRAEFVGVDILPEGNAPAKAKNKTILQVTQPKLFADLSLLIGLFGFYRNWIPLYETRIRPWRRIMKRRPGMGDLTKEEESQLLEKLWKANDRSKEKEYKECGDTNDELLESLKQEVLEGPVLKRPDSNRRFYLKTDWSAMAQAAVLLQADVTDEAEQATLNELWGKECEFEKKIEGLRLRPIYFISQHRVEASSRH